MKEKTIEIFYKESLREIERGLGNGITNSREVTEMGECLFDAKYKGTYAVDRLPKLKHGECCIINLDRSHQPGSHWVAVFKSNNKYVIYDSFGRKSSKILKSLKRLDIIDTDYDPEQMMQEDNCGQRSLAWLWCVYKLGIENALKI